MWALRRAANPLKNEGVRIGISRACCAKSEVLSSLEGEAGILESPQPVSDRYLKRFYCTTYFSSKLFEVRRSLSSQAGAKVGVEEDEVAELGASSNNADVKNEDGLFSEPELSDSEGDFEDPSENELELSDTIEKGEKGNTSALFNAIIAAPDLSVSSILDKWVAEGKELDPGVISLTKFKLRRRQMYRKALQLSEWLEANKRLDFVESDYASHLDLIARSYGLRQAEDYFKKIPESLRGELIYRTLLANCVIARQVKKAEEVFKKMTDLGFPLTRFACNQLLILYKMFNKKKIADVLLLMDRENVKPDIFTYQILIDVKGQSNDTIGIDKILERMKAEGIEPDTRTKITLAMRYADCGEKEKAEAILKEMEGGDLIKHRWACQILLPLYARLGKADEVRRVWMVCESNPWVSECLAAIKAWGQLKRVEEAEAVFDMMLKTYSSYTSSKQYLALLKVYADNKMLHKGKELVKRMSDNGRRLGPVTWDLLVKLYVEAGEVENANSLLRKVSKNFSVKPLDRSYMTLMRGYAMKGDIHNSEIYFQRMIEYGTVVRHWEFSTLLGAYVRAGSPAYGFKDRMKAHNLVPNKELLGKLAMVDPLRKKSASDVLD